MKSKKIILIVLISLISIGFFGMFVYFSRAIPKETASPPAPNPIGKTYGVKTVLEINGVRYEDEIAEEISVYDFMSKFRNEGKIDFTEKNYAGMGKFIVSINGIRGDGNKNWIYYVNGVEAQVGVSNYKIKSGDIISWKYE